MIELKKKTEERGVSRFNPGVPALIVGVIFVVNAGLIFATTAWSNLPDLGKMVLILAFAGIFFVASAIADRVLHIERTGKAFYILGSFFLFLTALAIGYFELLGPGFTLNGYEVWWVLLTGTVLSESALLIGWRKFKGRLYHGVCCLGMTVGVICLLNGLTVHVTIVIAGLLIYAIAVMAAGCIWPETALKNFALVQFSLFSVGGVLRVLWELFLCFVSKPHDVNGWIAVILAAMIVGTAVLAGSRKWAVFYVWHNLMLVLLFQYAALLWFSGFRYPCTAVAILCMICFLAGRYLKYPFRNLGSDIVLTGLAGLRVLLLIMLELVFSVDTGMILMVSAAVILFAVVWWEWSRQRTELHHALPLILCFLTYGLTAVCHEWFGIVVPMDRMVFAYLVILILWDLWKHDRMTGGILLIGTVAQLQVYQPGAGNYPFCVLLAGYLFLKVRNRYLEAKCLYLLAGVYFLVTRYTPNAVVDIWILMIVFAVEYLVVRTVLCQETKKANPFWYITGNVMVCFLLMCCYLGACFNSDLGIGYLLGSLLLFGFVYIWSFRSSVPLAHLPSAIIACLAPAVLSDGYGIRGDKLYCLVAVVLLIGGILFRLRWPILDDTGKTDWYHILAGIVLAVMAAAGERNWEFCYTLLLVLYVLQYAMLGQLRKEAWTMAMAVTAMAFWRQPFILVPERIWLEVQLLPIVVGAVLLPVIWGKNNKSKVLVHIQRTMYCGCLLALAGRTVCTEQLWDVMILEGICLVVFIWAQKVKNQWWVVVSGVLLVVEAVYQTAWFWLSVPWWIYLLAAGLGLIIFAAWHELKKD